MNYFLYSNEEVEEKNKILEKSGKKFEPGTVVINGVKKKFTRISNTPTIARCIDTKIVASGENLSDFTYTNPTTIQRR